MSKIIILEKNTRDQIAAGEVAERPAFIVKELVENAIDAGADDIRIQLKESGIREIRIVDNGSGIEKEDIPKAFLRHATSKLTKIDDLNTLKTMGFRGEALASIAAISKACIRTKAEGCDTAYECIINGGDVGEIRETAANQGTELIIEDLFFNTPARKKFLATPIREMREVSDIVGRTMIAHPQIRFELTNDGKRIFFTPGNGDIRTAIAGVYGKEPLKFLLPIGDSMIFNGFIAHPNYSKPNRNYYHFYINHRYIQSTELNKALEGAYKTMLPERRFPLAFINISLSPDLYDINVHPNKLEVKFDSKINIGEQLFEVIKSALKTGERAYTTDIHSTTMAKAPEKPFYEEEQIPPKIHQDLRPVGLPGAVERKRQLEEHQNDPNFLKAELTNLNRGTRREESAAISPKENAAAEKPRMKMKEPASPDFVNSLFGEPVKKEPVSAAEQMAAFLKEKAADSKERTGEVVAAEETTINYHQGFYAALNILGQIAGSFIVACNEEALYLIDQHAAHERLLFNKIKSSLEQKSGDVQALLIPLEVNLNYKQYNWVIENILVLHDMGFGLEVFGENSFILREIPTWAQNIDAVAFLTEFADGWLDQQEKLTMEQVLERKIMSKACKRAVKANHHLTDADMIYLFKELDQAPDAFTCPHGRPISVKFTIEEIRRKFLRT